MSPEADAGFLREVLRIGFNGPNELLELFRSQLVALHDVLTRLGVTLLLPPHLHTPNTCPACYRSGDFLFEINTYRSGKFLRQKSLVHISCAHYGSRAILHARSV
jgi:hypothetical protein